MKEYIYSYGLNLFSVFQRTPLYLILFVNDKCPNSCLHCWYSKEWKRENIKGTALTFDELNKLSKSIKKLWFLTMTGGEAFLRDDVEDIAQAFVLNSKVNRLDVPTSGFDSDLITERVENILKKINGTPFRVDVSLDGLKETHNFIRQNPHAFQNAVATIDTLKKLRKKHGNFDLSIITTISKHNINEIDALSKYVDEILPQGEWMVNITRPNKPTPTATEEVISAYKKAHIYVESRNKDTFGDKGHKLGKWLTAKNSLRREIILETLENKINNINCAAGSLAGVVFNDGEVRVCEALTDSLGNIRDYNYDMSKVWNSKVANDMRRKIQYTNCSCTQECYLSASILIQPICILKLIMKRFGM